MPHDTLQEVLSRLAVRLYSKATHEGDKTPEELRCVYRTDIDGLWTVLVLTGQDQCHMVKHATSTWKVTKMNCD